MVNVLDVDSSNGTTSFHGSYMVKPYKQEAKIHLSEMNYFRNKTYDMEQQMMALK